MSSLDKISVSILVPTFRRLHGIERALKSLISQDIAGLDVEIIVADNDPDGSAKDTVTSIAKSSPVKIIYLHCEEPGVSNARNAMMDVAKGRYILWLDDDQEASPDWVSGLIKTSQALDAALVFCPTNAVLEGAPERPDEYVRFFTRFGPETEKLIEKFHGCGNSLMDTSKFDLPDPVFDPVANQTGGEDDKLFMFIQEQGVKTGWTPHVHNMEYIPAGRSTPSYVAKRAIAWGQGPSQIAADHRDIPAIIKWMSVGLLQWMYWSVTSVFIRLTGKPGYINALRRRYEGLGKIFWWGGLKPKLYGASQIGAAANKTAPAAHHAKTPVQMQTSLPPSR